MPINVEQRPLQTVVETPLFLSVVGDVWDENEKAEFVNFIACNPEAGAVIPGTGGVRKVRWGRAGIGRRGGVRVIYFYHSIRLPLFLLTIYAKNVQENLTADQKKAMRKMAEAIEQRYGK